MSPDDIARAPRARHLPDLRAAGCAVAAFGLAAACAAGPAVAGDAAHLLENVSASFEALGSYERETQMTTDIEIGGQSMKQEVRTKEQVVTPGKHRSEVTMLNMTFLTVSNGETTWTYNPMVKQYTETTAATIDGARPAAGMAISESQLEAATEKATITYTETLTIGDRELECHVVTIDPSIVPAQEGVKVDGVRLWLSESSPFIVQVETRVRDIPTPMGAATGVITTALTSYATDAPIPDDAFVFTPPEGASKVEEFSTPAGPGGQASPLEGKPAPDFTGTTLAGETVTLSSLRGKVVLVDFWATWCGPCRMELPHIQKIREDHGEGLEILAVSNETRDKIASYIDSKGYTFTTVHDPSRTISGLYGVTSLPTVVIVDPEGNVATHLVGLRSEETLRAALADAGLGK